MVSDAVKLKKTALAFATALAGCAISAPASAHDDEYVYEPPEYTFVCPDGGYQSGCDSQDVQIAVSLADIDGADFASTCLFSTQASCSVMASGTINRATEEPPLHWQVLALQPADGPYAEMLILAEQGGIEMTLLFAEQVDGYFDPPVTVREGDGRFMLHVPARNRGLGNADLVLFSSGQGWNWTSGPELVDEVNQLLPEGFIAASPVVFNFREGSAFALVKRDEDAGCCATGGVVTIDFEQGDNTLEVSGVSFRETMPVTQSASVQSEQ